MAPCWLLLLLLSYSPIYETSVSSNIRSSNENKKVCMRDIGCFEVTEDFIDFKLRPINLLPQDRRLINTQFFLYTRNNPTDRYILIGNKPKTLINSPIDITLPTKFIVHGFLDTEFFAAWQVEMKDELMKKEEYNIIIVDWSGGNQLPYSQAAANTRVVGAEIAFLINQLQKYINLNIETCHIIGHSLGAHVAGYAGERLNKLHRITALDPAEPYFQDMPPSVRIDPTDAEFVDAIHTDSDSIFVLGFGMSQLVAHVDFFPNDGRKQPGCSTGSRIWSIFEDGLIEGIRKVASCSHQRAVDFFKSSINMRECQYIGHQCSNWTEFLKGNCVNCGPDGNDCTIMGLHADQFKVKDQNNSIQVFLKTSDRSPFCVHQYRITTHLSMKNNTSLKGKIKLGFVDETGEKRSLTINEKNEDLIPGTDFISVVGTPFKINLKNPIGFIWTSNELWTSHYMDVDYVEILPMNGEDETTQILLTTMYYQKVKGPIKEGQNEEMIPRIT